MREIVLGSLRVSLMVLVFGYLWWIGWKTKLEYQPAWLYIITGCVLISTGGFIEVTGSIVGAPTTTSDLIYQVLLIAVGYLVGFVLLLIGLWQWFPFIATPKGIHLQLQGPDLEGKRVSDLYDSLTECQQTASSPPEEEDRFRAIAQALPLPIVISRISDGTILYGNPQLGAMFGLPTKELIGGTTLDFYDNPADCQVLLQALHQEGYLHNYHVCTKKADGTPFWVVVSMGFLTFNREWTILTVFNNITNLPNSHSQQVEEALRDSEARHRRVVDGYITEFQQQAVELKARVRQQAIVAQLSQRGLSGIDLTTLMNEAVTLVAQTLEVEYCKVLELLPNGNVFLLRAGVGWSSGLVGYALVGAQANSQAGYTLLAGKPVVVEDLRVETRFSGPPLLYNHRVISGISVIIPGQEQPFGVLGAYTTTKRLFTEDDIHFLQAVANVLALTIEHKQSESNLHVMKRAIAASSNGVIITDPNQPDNPVIYVNPAFESMTGYSAEEVIGLNCRFLQGSNTNQSAIAELATAVQEQRECHVILQNYRKDGSHFWNELYVSPVFDAEGYLSHFIGIQTDITERRRAEEALRESEERLDSILSSLEDVVWSAVVETAELTYINAAATKVYGRAVAEFKENPNLWLEVIHPEDRQRVEMTSEIMLAVGSKDLQYRILRPNGEVRWLHDRSRVIYDTQGRPLRLDGIATDITERKQAEEALLKSEEQFRLTFELAPIGMAISTLEGHFLRVNQALCDALGYTSQELLTRTFADISHPDDLVANLIQSQKLLQGELSHFQMEKRYLTKQGQVVHAILKITVVRDSRGKPLHCIAQVVDITERKRAEEALLQSKQRLNGILSSLDDVVWSASASTFETLYLNAATEKVYGRLVSDFFDTPNLWFEVVHPDDEERMAQQMTVLLETGSMELEYRIVRPDNEVRWLYRRSRLVYGADGMVIRIDGIDTDITDRKLMEEQLLYDAFHDALTGLPNRALFMDRLGYALRRVKRRGNYLFAVMFLDLDRFKIVNDSLGHMVGDQLLIAIARRLEGCLRHSDTLARLGGDEFAILLDDIRDVSEATGVAESIHQALKLPFNLNQYEVFTTASIGIALSATGYDQPEDLLRDADTAMYRAKEHGTACHAVFDTAMYNCAVALLQLETDLRWAIERQELEVYYQPIVSLSSGKIAGFEALVRWQHPEQGMISPAEFIPLAEETGLIIPIGQWVLYSACCQLRQWQEQLKTHVPLSMSVNLSGKQFSQPDLIEQIDRILQETGLEPSRLKLEITESGIMENAESVAALLEELKALNIQLCIDDFGTGYSSLSRLHQFPIDSLKIDRSFVSRMSEDGENGEIVQAIVTLAHNLGMDVVAEGVETVTQLNQLRGRQCEYAQGYFFSRPLNSKAVQKLMAIAPEW